ncbi:hypothetical protein QT806_23435, partial [Xanthomonas citri pv. citri]
KRYIPLLVLTVKTVKARLLDYKKFVILHKNKVNIRVLRVLTFFLLQHFVYNGISFIGHKRN